MKAMKGKCRPELSWEARSPKISILPPVNIKKRGKIKRGIVKRERDREHQLDDEKGPMSMEEKKSKLYSNWGWKQKQQHQNQLMRGFLELLLLYPFTESIHKIKDWIEEREREREPNNQNETLALDLATISGPEVTHKAVDFGFGALDLGFGAHRVIDKYAITVGLVSNLNNLWALLWAFA